MLKGNNLVLAELLAERGKVERARELVAELLKSTPEDADEYPRTTLLSVRLKLLAGQRGEAFAQLSRLSRSHPGNLTVTRALVQFHIDQGNLALAEKLSEDVLKEFLSAHAEANGVVDSSQAPVNSSRNTAQNVTPMR